MKFDIIMPSYGQFELTVACLQSLVGYSKDFRVIWIDNKRECFEFLHTPDSRIRYFPQAENLGYTKSINLGLAVSTAPYVVLLNSDTEVMTDGWLEKLAEGFGPDPNLAACGPATDRLQQGLAGTLPKKSGLHYLTPSMTPHGILDVKLWFWCIMLKREAILDVGYLDERFSPGGGDDDDWLMRAYAKGWKAAIQTDVLVKHVGQASWLALESLEARSERAHRLLREKYDTSVHELHPVGD